MLNPSIQQLETSEIIKPAPKSQTREYGKAFLCQLQPDRSQDAVVPAFCRAGEAGRPAFRDRYLPEAQLTMRFNPEILDREVERQFKGFFKWTGEETWRKKIAKLDRSPQFSGADVYRQYLQQRNPISVCVGEYFEFNRQGKSVSKHLGSDLKKAADI